MDVGFTTSSTGIQGAVAEHSARARRIAGAAAAAEGGEAPSVPLEKDLAELPQDPRRLGMNTQVIKTRDEMLGTLLDLFA